MKLEKIQFITHQNSKYNYLESAILALENGIRFIQLRMKNASREDIVSIGKILRKECNKYNATLIIDDYVELVSEIGADGVHLGKMDMSIDKAREILGENKIIGGTANSFEDILLHFNKGVNYIGLGPFRFTNTKEVLSPILGLEGYKEIIDKCKEKNITIPIYAIGGIRLEDLNSIKDIGVYGIAISSIILDSDNPAFTTRKILDFSK